MVLLACKTWVLLTHGVKAHRCRTGLCIVTQAAHFTLLAFCVGTIHGGLCAPCFSQNLAGIVPKLYPIKPLVDAIADLSGLANRD